MRQSEGVRTEAANNADTSTRLSTKTAADVPIKAHSSRVSKCEDHTGMNQVLVYLSVMKT